MALSTKEEKEWIFLFWTSFAADEFGQRFVEAFSQHRLFANRPAAATYNALCSGNEPQPRRCNGWSLLGAPA